ncbi:NAD(P)-binding protein [Exidia glandulosa HHB12029]|uniref:NAD(P)-binding protein n=1 Tax=Exidia glandulosa HHB12029 TaxID=1314781 RepID=A0A165KC17_EXIGL|nr:NAD(P)-binding protein [Exidia glandulosa HHB12029]
MAPVRNSRVFFNSIPEGYPVLGETLVVDHAKTIDLETVSLEGGKILVKTVAISIDPFLRLHMSRSGRHHGTAYHLGEPIYNFQVVKVLRSGSELFRPGQHLYGVGDFVEYQVLSDLSKWTALPEREGIPWSVYLGAAGMPGKTAYFGWKVGADAKKGETIYVSTAAGAVGSMVVQLAKAAGLKVIASAGQEAKLEFLRELGADVVFNYKTTDLANVLEEHGPLDICWDHVGGDTLATVISNMKDFGRILVMGFTAAYNAPSASVTNLGLVLVKRLTLRGIAVGDHEAQCAEEFYAAVPAKLAKGELKYKETVVRSLDEVPQLFIDVQKGNNTGKAVVVLDD